MVEIDYLLMLTAMGAVTYFPRMMPLLLLAKRELPTWFVEWLDLIPAAILSALLMPALVTTGTPRVLDLVNPEVATAIPVFLVAIYTRSLGGTVLAGMGIYWLAGLF
ncbi:MAG: AzlD domain-containing protein [Desulfobacterales bacterium]|nr:AzlD domain-containing protein [Desulfobacterales bacterium]